MMTSPYLLPVLAMIVFFTGVTEFMVSPMLTPLAEAFSVTPAQSSWLIAVYTLSYAIAAPFMGRISDRVNRYKLLQAALLLFAADGFALALAPGFAAAAGLRVLGGLASAALIPTVFSLIAEQFPPSLRANVGIFILLPGAAALLASQGSTVLLFASVILLCVATGLTGYLIRPVNDKK